MGIIGDGKAATVIVGRGCSMARGGTTLEWSGVITDASFYL